QEIGFLDDAFGTDVKGFETELRERAQQLAQDPQLRSMLRKKHESRLDDEAFKPLASYRAEELEKMRVNFFGNDPAYHEARRRFVFKGKPPLRESRPILDNSYLSGAPLRGNGSAHALGREAAEFSGPSNKIWVARLLGVLRRRIETI